MKGFKIRLEEYTTLADFILPSFTRDLSTFQQRFPKFDNTFLQAFTAKTNFVKTLESKLVITEAQKNATASLYQEADVLNTELNFVKTYFQDANLNTTIVTDIKNDLFSHNIEGAVLKIESLKQFITANQTILEQEGMSPNFTTQLEAHKVSFQLKNKDQSEFMKQIKTLTDNNKTHYEELYQFISKVATKGKLLFPDSRIKEEYNISKNLAKMRVAKPTPKP
jgi:hypothetical protein